MVSEGPDAAELDFIFSLGDLSGDIKFFYFAFAGTQTFQSDGIGVVESLLDNFSFEVRASVNES